METLTQTKKPSSLLKYPFATMAKDDEFAIEDQTEDGAKKVRAAAAQFKIRTRKPWKFSVKLQEDNVYRCKRIK